MPRLVIDARYVRPGMTGVGYWALELTRALARVGRKDKRWTILALTLPPAERQPSSRSRTRAPATPGPSWLSLLRGDEQPSPNHFDPQGEDERDRLERLWKEAEGLRRIVVPIDYEDHPRADFWLHAGGLSRLLRTLKTDVFLSPTFLLPVHTPCPRIATLLDFIAWRYPKSYPPGFRYFVRFSTRLAARRAHALVALSESVRRDAKIILGASRRKIRVIHPGVGPEFRPIPEGQMVAMRTAFGLPPPPYFVWVGTLEPRKDLPTAIRAFERLRETSHYAGHSRPRPGKASDSIPPPPGGDLTEPTLLVIGRRCPGCDSAVAAIRGSVAHRAIQWVSDLPRGVLAAAMSGACALVSSSRYEGFGLPLLEAMACGTPVIATSTSSIPEVLADAGLLVPPANPEPLAEAMRLVLRSGELRNELARKGLARARTLTWDRTAKSVLELASQVASRHSR